MPDLAHTPHSIPPPSPARDAIRPARPCLAARRHPLPREVARRLDGPCVWGGGPLVIGVSGGADSLALLTAVTVLARRRNAAIACEPVAVHVHHHLRDAAADADARHVAAVCNALDVECQVEHIDPGRLPGNTARHAREQRYERLACSAAARGASAVAVAHHADDQLETMLMSLCRGADPLTLAMAWQRPLAHGVRLLRPLLATRAAACRAYCQVAGLAWREDPTNVDPATPRGRLRRDVLPVLETLWPNGATRAALAADMLPLARQAVETQAAEIFGPVTRRSWPRATLRTLPEPLVGWGLRRAAIGLVPGCADALSRRHLARAAEHITGTSRAPKRFVWPRALRVEVTARSVELTAATERRA